MAQLDQYQHADNFDNFVTEKKNDLSSHLPTAGYKNTFNSKKVEELVLVERDCKEKGGQPSDKFLSARTEQYSASPGDVFLFSKNFDPAEPHQESKTDQNHHPLSDLVNTDPNYDSTFKRLPSLPPLPSKIPINEGYLERSGGSLRKRNNLSSSVEKSGGKMSTPKHLALEKNSGIVTTPKPSRPGLEKGGSKVTTPKSVPPRSSRLDQIGGSGTRPKIATSGLDRSLSTPKYLPESYPDRPRHDRQPTGTKVKSPNP